MKHKDVRSLKKAGLPRRYTNYLEDTLSDVPFDIDTSKNYKDVVNSVPKYTNPISFLTDIVAGKIITHYVIDVDPETDETTVREFGIAPSFLTRFAAAKSLLPYTQRDFSLEASRQDRARQVFREIAVRIGGLS